MSLPGSRTVTVGGAIWSVGDGITTDDKTEAANRTRAAFEAVHEAVLRLLQEGKLDPP